MTAVHALSQSGNVLVTHNPSCALEFPLGAVLLGLDKRTMTCAPLCYHRECFHGPKNPLFSAHSPLRPPCLGASDPSSRRSFAFFRTSHCRSPSAGRHSRLVSLTQQRAWTCLPRLFMARSSLLSGTVQGVPCHCVGRVRSLSPTHLQKTIFAIFSF